MTGVLPQDWRPWNWHTHGLVSPRHAHTPNKPVVNVAIPPSALSNEYQAQKFGMGPSMWVPWSGIHFFLLPEVVPYIDSYSSWECCYYLWGMMNLSWLNVYTARKSAGYTNPMNPRTMWAHKVVFCATLARLQAAWLIGVCGFFYTYEFCYTHVPMLKINDPSPEGWKKPWREGQTTFGARAVACLWAYPAWYVFKGTHKRGIFGLGFHMFIQLWYEFNRVTLCSAGDRGMYHIATLESKKQELHGQLAPECYRIPEADGNRPQVAYSYENLRFLHSDLVKQAEVNKSHDYQPLNLYSANIPNPYFDFEKAAQMDRDKKLRYKTDTFELLNPMHGLMRTGVLDDRMADLA